MNDQWKATAQSSDRPVRRFLFGAASLICGLAFGAAAAAFWMKRPANWQNAVFLEVLRGGFTFLTVFMVIVAVTFWFPGSVKSEYLLARRSQKGFLYIIAFAIGIMVFTVVRLAAR